MTGQLDPQARAVLDTIEDAGAPAYYDLPLAEARDAYVAGSRAFADDRFEVAEVRDLEIPTAEHALRVRLYHPQPGQTLPVVVYFHGGGFVLGDLDSHDNLCRYLAQESGWAVVSVDYRMGPDHPFPAALDDSLTAIQWVFDQGAALGVDAGHLAVGGDSAGGNLAAVAARNIRDRGGPAICHQLLIYPVIDLAMDTPSHAAYGEGYRLSRALLQWFYDSYRGDSGSVDDPDLSPLRAGDLTNLPPATIITAGFDPLLDEGKAYADALKQAGCDVEYRCFEGQIHSFCNMLGAIDQGKEALDICARRLPDAPGR